MTFLLIAGYPDSILNFRGPLIESLLLKGIKVHVAAPDFVLNSELQQRLLTMGVVVHDIPLRRTGMNPFSDLILLLHLFRLMCRIRPKITLGYTVKPVIYGSLAAMFARVPQRYALITGLGYAFQGEGQRNVVRSLVVRLYALALSRVQKVFFQNKDDEALFRSLGVLNVATPSCVVNGSGVDLSVFKMAPLRQEPLCFLLIARLLGGKGVREYVEAARQVKVQSPQVLFQLVGWIDDNPDSIQQSELNKWVAEGTVNYLGKLYDVRPAIADCSVYVLPSYREGTPRTVLEAMAMGRAVITTDAPGCRETVIDGDNGFLVTAKSVDGLVEAILRFVANPSLVERMGYRSRQIVEDKYDVKKVNSIMLREMGLT